MRSITISGTNISAVVAAAHRTLQFAQDTDADNVFVKPRKGPNAKEDTISLAGVGHLACGDQYFDIMEAIARVTVDQAHDVVLLRRR